MNQTQRIKGILYALIAIFILIAVYFLLPTEIAFKRELFPAIAILGFAFLSLGSMLIYLGRKEKGKLNFYLILTGTSAIGPFAGSVLHNLFYGLAMTFESLKYVFEFLQVSFFLIALLIAPILFIIGVIGCMVSLKK
ncbi:hypothetical protein JXD20_03305 [Candidatus Peregrinibacteria bacterium]|nr:hypothetical protein [Candidatus Peregrinibacteria bacterium]